MSLSTGFALESKHLVPSEVSLDGQAQVFGGEDSL